jgi:cystathionine beta-lyase/cystathionine gamma-synthase
MEMHFVEDAFNSNWIAPLGPHVDGFEADLEQYLGGGYAAALSSGTAAIHLALIILGIKQGDEVICQSLTFSASANPVVYQGATPVFRRQRKGNLEHESAASGRSHYRTGCGWAKSQRPSFGRPLRHACKDG